MANATVSRLGQAQATGDAKALFLKVFGGEVLTAFEETNVFADKHMVRTIQSGKSAQFPATWKFAAETHTPGAEINGTVMKHAERVITIDDLLIAHAFLANIDEAMNHYDVRSIYSTQLGAALAREYDINVARNGILAARDSATITGGTDAGGTLADNAYATTGATIASGIYTARQILDEGDVNEAAYCYLRPAQFYLAVQETGNINRDWGGAGSFSKGTLPEIGGVAIVKTNNLPSTNVTGATYNGDFSKTQGLVMTQSAVGTVKLMDLAMESEYDIRRQGTLMVAKYAMGHGILRPEAAVELATV